MNYEELLEKAKEIYESEDTPHFFKAWLLANIICPTNMNIEDDVKHRTQVFEYARSLDTCNQYSRANIDRLIAWLENQDEQKQTWKPTEAQLIVIKDLIEDENTSKVNKVILRGMLNEFKQYFGL